jgi:type IV fimbrial biogenesis protein FimT
MPHGAIAKLLAMAPRGFTLLELMVTLAVLAVLITVGIPAFAELVQNNRVTAQTNELVSALNVARSEAVKRGRNVQVVVAAETNGWSAAVSVVGGGDPVRVINRADSVVTVNAGTVVFRPTGVPVAATEFGMQPAGECSGDKRRQVAITPSGQVRTTRQTCV